MEQDLNPTGANIRLKNLEKFFLICERLTVRNETADTRRLIRSVKEYLIDLVTGVGFIDRQNLMIELEVDGYYQQIGEEDHEIRFVSTYVKDGMIHDFLEDLEEWHHININVKGGGLASLVMLTGPDRIHGSLRAELADHVTYLNTQMTYFEIIQMIDPVIYRFGKQGDHLKWGAVLPTEDPEEIPYAEPWEFVVGLGSIEFETPIPKAVFERMKKIAAKAAPDGPGIEFSGSPGADGVIHNASMESDREIHGDFDRSRIQALVRDFRLLFAASDGHEATRQLSYLFSQTDADGFRNWLMIELDEYYYVRLICLRQDPADMSPYRPLLRSWMDRARSIYQDNAYEVSAR